MSQEIKEVIKQELEAFKQNLPTYATPEDVSKAIEGIEEKFDGTASKADIQELKDIAEAQGLAMQKFTEKKAEPETLKDQLNAVKDSFKDIQNGKIVTIKTDVARASVSEAMLSNM